MARVNMSSEKTPQTWRLTFTLGREDKEDEICQIVTQNLGSENQPVRVAGSSLSYTFTATKEQAKEVLGRIEKAVNPKTYQITFALKNKVSEEKFRQIQKDFLAEFSVPLEKSEGGFTCKFLAGGKKEAEKWKADMQAWLFSKLAEGAEEPLRPAAPPPPLPSPPQPGADLIQAQVMAPTRIRVMENLDFFGVGGPFGRDPEIPLLMRELWDLCTQDENRETAKNIELPLAQLKKKWPLSVEEGVAFNSAIPLQERTLYLLVSRLRETGTLFGERWKDKLSQLKNKFRAFEGDLSGKGLAKKALVSGLEALKEKVAPLPLLEESLNSRMKSSNLVPNPMHDKVTVLMGKGKTVLFKNQREEGGPVGSLESTQWASSMLKPADKPKHEQVALACMQSDPSFREILYQSWLTHMGKEGLSDLSIKRGQGEQTIEILPGGNYHVTLSSPLLLTVKGVTDPLSFVHRTTYDLATNPEGEGLMAKNLRSNLIQLPLPKEPTGEEIEAELEGEWVAPPPPSTTEELKKELGDEWAIIEGAPRPTLSPTHAQAITTALNRAWEDVKYAAFQSLQEGV